MTDATRPVPGLASVEYRDVVAVLGDPVMRRTRDGSRYLLGRSEALDCLVSVHYRKGTSERPGRYVVHWPQSATGPVDLKGEHREIGDPEELLAFLSEPASPKPF